MSRCSGRVYIAEITVLEIVSALGTALRGKRITLRSFTQGNRKFLRDIAAGRLIVVPLPGSELVACRELLMLVGIDAARSLKTQDAMVAYTVRRLALELGEAVRFLTSDRRLAQIINDLPIFEKLVISEYLDPN